MLVLIDGRSVYSPLFSGVFWDAQDVLMADIERIEVLSGPGATIWGVNAVNGVINVITKTAAATQGALVAATYGEPENGALFRFGGRLDNGMHMRIYGKSTELADGVNATGTRRYTGMIRRQAGFRADLDIDSGSLRLSGDAYQGRLDQMNTRDMHTAGANLAGTYTGKTAGGGDLRVHLIIDHTQRDQPNAFREHLNTLEAEAQHGMRSGRHTIVWGGGYRRAWDRIVNGPGYGFLPANLRMSWANLFAQDEVALTERLRATAGLKLEYNHYTGNELLPNLRLAYALSEHHLFWGSLARTVRAPSRIDRDFYSPIDPLLVNGVPRYAVGGGPNFVSEVARVAELGYRGQPRQHLSWSATVWVADYDRRRTLEPARGGPAQLSNLGEGRSRGIETWMRWTVTPHWRLDGGAVIQHISTWTQPASRDIFAGTGIATNDPRRRYTLRSSHDISPASQFEWSLRYVGALPRPAVPSYHEVDLHWIWTPNPRLDIMVSGQNLLKRSHPEFGAAANRSVHQRAVLLSAAYRF